MIITHVAVRRAVVTALTSKPLDGVQAAMEEAARQLCVPLESVEAVIDAKDSEGQPA